MKKQFTVDSLQLTVKSLLQCSILNGQWSMNGQWPMVNEKSMKIAKCKMVNI